MAAGTANQHVGGAGTSCISGNDVYIIYGSVPGIGALQAQALFNAAGRDRGVELLAAGQSPEQILTAITDEDFDGQAASRQYGVVNVDGSSAGFTGDNAQSFAADVQGQIGQYTYSVQGNILTSDAVLSQAASAFEGNGCDLAERLMLALEAGALGGEGDSRCTASRGTPSDSAFLQVDRPGEERGAFLSLRVPTSGSESPLPELRRLFDEWRVQNPCPEPPLDAGAETVDAANASGGAGSAGTAGNGVAGSSEEPVPRDEPAQAGGAASVPRAGTGGVPPLPPVTPRVETDGCGCRLQPGRSGVAWWPLAALAGLAWRRQRRGRGWLWFGAAAALLAGCHTAPAPAFGSGLAQVAPVEGGLALERAMVDRLNRDRAQRGLPPLELDLRLGEIARHHSADMRDHGFFEHESPNTGSVENRLDAAGYLFLTARENLSEAPDIERAQDSLLNSPPHYENIMSSDVTHVGIGIVRGGREPNNLTITQVFATPYQVEAPDRAERAIAERVKLERSRAGLPPARRDARLAELARQNLEVLDHAGSAESVERAGDNIAAALRGKVSARLAVSTQIVPGSAQLTLPPLVLQAKQCAFGLAARRVKTGQGRPALQVLLLASEATK